MLAVLLLSHLNFLLDRFSKTKLAVAALCLMKYVSKHVLEKKLAVAALPSLSSSPIGAAAPSATADYSNRRELPTIHIPLMLEWETDGEADG